MKQSENKTSTTSTEGKAPVTPSTTTNATSTNTTTDTSTTSMTATTSTAPAILPRNYCADGSMVDAEGILRPEYVSEYAQALAEALKPMKASAFHTSFLREAKEARKKKVSYGTKKNCAMGMVTQAKKLVHRKKDPAPGVLVEMIQAATATVQDSATFEALYMHLDAVYSCLLIDD